MNLFEIFKNETIVKNQVEPFLIFKLDQSTNFIQFNLFQEFLKKINSFYSQFIINNTTTFNLYGYCQ